MEQSPAQESVIGPETAAGKRLARFLDATARWAVWLSILLIPLFYLPFTVEGLELSKQLLLIVLAVVATLAWLGRMLVERKVAFRRTVMSLLVGIYAVIYALTAWFSKSRYASFVGDFGQEKAGVVTLVCFILLFFVGVNVLRGSKDVKHSVSFALLGGFIAIAFTYLQALGLRLLPGSAAASGSFNLMGTPNALGVYAGCMLALLMGLFLVPEDGKWIIAKRIVQGILAALSIFYVAMQGFWAVWMVLIAGAAVLVFYGLVKTERVKKVTMLALPMAIIVLGIVFSFVRFPIGFGAPSEVMPSLKASWNIARNALASSPLFGSGPGTFLYDYAQFHSPELNQTQFWNVHFDRSSSRLLTMLATTGILGIAALLVLLIYLGFRTAARLWKGSSDWALTLAIFSAWIALGVGKVLYSSNLTLEFLFWMLTMLLVVIEWDQWQEAKFERSPRAALMLSFFFIVAAIFGITGLYLEGQRYAAELSYASGVNRNPKTVKDVDASIADLVRAAQLNGQNDLFYRTLSQTYSLRANLEAQQVGAKPTADDAQRIATLAANAIQAGKMATNLDTTDVQNWASLSNLYSDLVGSTQGADAAAIDAFQKAIALEPNNPSYYTDLGRVYLTLSDINRQQASQAKDDATKKQAGQASDENLKKAEDQFNKSIVLKSDYAAAHYWLAITYQREGKMKEAVQKLENALSLSPNDLGVAFQLGIMYFQNGDKDKAIALLERITEVSPQYADAQWYLSAMYEDAGRIDDAIARVQIVLQNNKNNTDVQKRLDDLTAKKNGTSAAPSQGLPAPVTTPSDSTVIDTKAPAPTPAPGLPPAAPKKK